MNYRLYNISTAAIVPVRFYDRESAVEEAERLADCTEQGHEVLAIEVTVEVKPARLVLNTTRHYTGDNQ